MHDANLDGLMDENPDYGPDAMAEDDLEDDLEDDPDEEEAAPDAAPDSRPYPPRPAAEEKLTDDWSMDDLDALRKQLDECNRLAAAEAAIPKKFSARGTPCAKSWDDAWIEHINETETRLDRNICGARTPSGDPCSLPSNHRSGRCRFHGGFDLTGAPKGNRNAVVHGLYARRLLTCGPHCARWASCPCAGQDVLDLAPAQRPTCPYEQMEFNTYYTDARAKFGSDPMAVQDAHHLALLHVMSGRAAAALAVQPMTESTTVETPNYRCESTRVSAPFQAYTRLSAEFRALRKFCLEAHHIDPEKAWTEPAVEEVVCQCISADEDTRLDPDAAPLITPAFNRNDEYANYLIRMAFRHAAAGRDVALSETLLHAFMMKPTRVMMYQDRILGAYRPKGATMPKEAIKHLIALLTGQVNNGYPGDPPKPGGPIQKPFGVPICMLGLGKLS